MEPLIRVQLPMGTQLILVLFTKVFFCTLSANEFKDYLVRTDSEKTYKIKMFLVTLVSEPKPNPIDFENSGWFSQGDIENLEFVSNCKQRLVEYYREYSRK